jgi:hypothetical protein
MIRLAMPDRAAGRFRFEHPMLLVLETYALTSLVVAFYFIATLAIWRGDKTVSEVNQNLLLFQVPLVFVIAFLLFCSVRWLRLNQAGVRWLILASAILLVALVVASPYGLTSLVHAINQAGQVLLHGDVFALYPFVLLSLLWMRLRSSFLVRLHLEGEILDTPFGRIFLYDVVLLFLPLLVIPSLWMAAFLSVIHTVMPVWLLWLTVHLIALARREQDPFAPLRHIRSPHS